METLSHYQPTELANVPERRIDRAKSLQTGVGVMQRLMPDMTRQELQFINWVARRK